MAGTFDGPVPGTVPAELAVLARGPRWAVVAKPSGLVIHPSHYAGQFRDTAVQILARQFGCKVHAVHRLDAATSGLLLVAFDAEAVALLSAQFVERTVDKRYLAIVRGWPAPAGRIEHPLEDERGRRQDATTDYRRLAIATFDWPTQRHPQARYALIEARPEQGRRHQIRRHLKAISHPLVGDARYGKGEHNRLFRQHLDAHRLLLHASWLRFVVPEGGVVEVQAPPDPLFERVLARPEWQYPATPGCDDRLHGEPE